MILLHNDGDMLHWLPISKIVTHYEGSVVEQHLLFYNRINLDGGG